MYRGYKIAIVVPAYNEAELISETLKGMPDIADSIYVVDDGSTDDTRSIVEGFNGGRFHIMTNGHNTGVGATIVRGYKKALSDKMDIMVVMAGDNQMDATYLPELVEPIIDDGVDYTKGSRLSKCQHSRSMSKWRLFGNWILTVLTKVASGYWHIRDSQNGYTAITSNTLKQIDLESIYPRYGYCNDILVKLNIAGCKVTDVPIPARYATEKSKIKYSTYVWKVSSLLLRSTILRLKMKYLGRGISNNK